LSTQVFLAGPYRKCHDVKEHIFIPASKIN
jgi:hypothetical protein